ncbi:hypothetical protein CALVIDRAFT_390160 [Calocera viscosa TUFC12733]|uniref:Signal recognition particle subunit SRP72 n=1 Tax=Calocera viscosa (strain TUFC12733) TaxID=1330018 RepID=A0A167GIC4_CALVF|nr:hypothetical protein CALVIDRAFT_390160 [Calocera viscosa TUFC12733]
MVPTAAKRRQPRTNKAPKSLDDRISTLFRSLAAQLDGGHYQNALQNCDRILKLLPDDRDAAETKLYIFLQLERYRDALELITAFPLDLVFERAYCLYRLQERDQAFAVLEQLKIAGGEKRRGLEHLEAQLRYRDASYEECQALYTHLLNTCPEDGEESDDVLNNLGAAQSYLDFINSGYQEAIHELNLDVPSLEGAPPTLLAISAAPLAVSTSTPSIPRAAQKSRIPKHVVVGVTPLPDPERWLKKRDRTRDVRRTKKGKKEGMGAGATQGVVVGAAPTPPATGGTGGGKKKKKQNR